MKFYHQFQSTSSTSHELQNFLKLFSFERMYKTVKQKFAINECKESRYTVFVRLLLALLADSFLTHVMDISLRIISDQSFSCSVLKPLLDLNIKSFWRQNKATFSLKINALILGWQSFLRKSKAMKQCSKENRK